VLVALACVRVPLLRGFPRLLVRAPAELRRVGALALLRLLVDVRRVLDARARWGADAAGSTGVLTGRAGWDAGAPSWLGVIEGRSGCGEDAPDSLGVAEESGVAIA
jgi:hypothetical protein